MHFFKHVLVGFLITLSTLFILACEGGEADYSLDEVQSQRFVEDLINGTITFISEGTMVIDDDNNIVTTIKADTSENIVYSIVGGADQALFKIDERTGMLSFIETPAYDVFKTNVYEVIVGLTTASGEISTLQMLVTVVDDISVTVPLIDSVVTNIDAVSSNAVITQIKARPADESSYVTYVVKGVDADRFIIDENGNLSFDQPLPDFGSTPDEVYAIYIEITDGHGNTVSTEMINITLVGNRDLIRPVVESAAFSIAENALGNIQIEVISLGTGTVNKYILSGNDAAQFTVSSSGLLQFKEAKDFETPPTLFNFNIQVEDDKGNVSDIKPLVLNVVDIDEGYDFQTISDFTPIEGAKSVGKITATSRTLTDVVTAYSLSQGADAFEIDSLGNLQFKGVALKGQSYSVQVMAWSQVPGTQELINGSQTLSPVFNVTVVEDPSQVVPSINTSYSVLNEVVAPIDTDAVITTVAAAPDGNATVISYSTGGADLDKFSVDSNGNLYFNSTYSYTVDGDNTFEVIVHVQDNNGNVSSTEVITIELLQDPSTIAPVVISSTFSVNENELGNMQIQTYTDGSGIVDTYTIVGGDDALKFDLVNGYLRFKVAPDFESDVHSSDYHLLLQVTDSNTNVSDIKAIVVNVQDVDESLIFTSLTSFNYTEYTSFSRMITVSPVPNTTITYSIASGNEMFVINETTGELTFKVAPIYQVDGNNQYTVEVNASSQYNGSMTKSPLISITVLPADRTITFVVSSVDNTIFDANGEAHLEQGADTSISITATSASGHTLTYAIEGDSSIFVIDPVSGEMTISAPAYIFSDEPEINTYRAVVVATANDAYGTSDRLPGVMHVNAVNGVPTFISTAEISVDENMKVLPTVVAISPIGSSLLYEIVDGADSGLFNINVSTGELSFTYSQDFEDPKDLNRDYVYEVNVRVKDSNPLYTINTATQLIKVSVQDVDEAINFVNVSDFSVDEGTTVTRQLSASSAAGYKMSYSVLSGYDSEIAVTVDSDTGILSVKAVTYHFYVFLLNPNYHTITVVATDPYGNKVSQNIEIRVRS